MIHNLLKMHSYSHFAILRQSGDTLAQLVEHWIASREGLCQGCGVFFLSYVSFFCYE